MSIRAIPAPLWFVAALVPLVMSQIVRLEQSDPATWISWDYAGRLGALAVLGAIPSARAVAFQRERLRMTYWEAASWIVGIVLFDRYVCGWIRRTLNAALPATVLGGYPEPYGWLVFIARWRSIRAVASQLRLTAELFDVRSEADIVQAFSTMVDKRLGALSVGIDFLIQAHAARIVELAAQQRIPTAYPTREMVEIGGLLSYSINYRVCISGQPG